MKKLEIIIKPEKLEDLKAVLESSEVNGLNIVNSMGYGNQKGIIKNYRGASYNVTGDLIFRIVFFIKTQRSIGTISGKHITARIVCIAGAVHFISQCLQLLQNDLAVRGFQISVRCLGALSDHIRDDLCQVLQCLLGYVQPALRIRNVLAVILRHLGHIAA